MVKIKWERNSDGLVEASILKKAAQVKCPQWGVPGIFIALGGQCVV